MAVRLVGVVTPGSLRPTSSSRHVRLHGCQDVSCSVRLQPFLWITNTSSRTRAHASNAIVVAHLRVGSDPSQSLLGTQVLWTTQPDPRPALLGSVKCTSRCSRTQRSVYSTTRKNGLITFLPACNMLVVLVPSSVQVSSCCNWKCV